MALRLGISSMSLGRAWVHDLPSKLEQAARHGIEGVEIFFEDLQYVAKTLPGGLNAANELEAAKIIGRVCKFLGLDVISLQPCWADEGLLDPNEWAAKIEDFRHRIKIAKALGTDLLLIPSGINVSAEKLSTNAAFKADQLREVAKIGAAEGVRFAHESLCWGTTSDTWEASWDLVKRVNQPNFGICLDTFNIAGRIFADPASPTGKTPDAAQELEKSLARLVREIDPQKVFFVQVVDAERLQKPLDSSHEYHGEGQPPRMSWSRNCRLFYGETERGAYLPVKEVADAIFTGLGWHGWVSMELFSRTMNEADRSVPSEHARRAMLSWKALVQDCNLHGARFRPPFGAVQATTPALPPRKMSDLVIPPAMNRKLQTWERVMWAWIGISSIVGSLGSAKILYQMLYSSSAIAQSAI